MLNQKLWLDLVIELGAASQGQRGAEKAHVHAARKEFMSVVGPSGHGKLIDSILVDGKLDRHGIHVEPLKRKIVYLF